MKLLERARVDQRLTTVWDPSRLGHRWFARVADLVARIAPSHDWPSIAALNDAFAVELAAVGVRLVESQKTKPALVDGAIDPASLYEVRIVEHGEIPTRPRNAHDLLNTIAWAAFPQTKLALTRALAGEQRRRAAGRATLPSTRSREHDRLALIDEGGLVIVGASTWIFGHAIYEHAYEGNFAVRGAPIDLDLAPSPELLDLAHLAIPDARAIIDRTLAAADLPNLVRSGPGIAVE